jgi:hypothetical protein
VTEPPEGTPPDSSPVVRIEIEPPEGTPPGSVPPLYVEIGPSSTIVHNYRFFYYLANEMAYLAREKSEQYKSDPERHTPLNEYRYCIATVIFAFTYADAYVNHLMHSPDSPVAELFGEMSPNLRGSIDRLSLPEKVEYVVLHHPDSKVSKLDRSREPFQSFDLLRQLRNFLVHYKPRSELTDFISKEHYEKEAISLEHKVSGKFAFNEALAFKEGSSDSTGLTHAAAFVYRCFSKDCAKWSFEVGRDFVNWIGHTLSIQSPSLQDFWSLGDDQ